MALTASSFRLMFPAFGDTTKYSDPMVTMWLDYATKRINVERWGELADTGVGLITAHTLVLEAQSVAQASAGAAPGGKVGVQTSKSVDGVSVSYDVSSATVAGAGHWNQTTYGTRFMELSRMMGAGPMQVGSDAVVNSVSAWYGPPLMP